MLFENQVKELERKMIDLSLDFANHQVDGVYIYCVTEKYVQSFDVFYRIGKDYIERHDLNDFFDSERQIDKSSDRVFEMLHQGVDYEKELQNLYTENGKAHPTELWIIYDTQTNQWETSYSYDARYENSPLEDIHMTPYEEFEKWFEQVKAQEL